MNSLPCWPPSLLLLWGLEDMFNILLYSSSSPLIQPQPQVPATLRLLMARDERRGAENPLIMTSVAFVAASSPLRLPRSFCTGDVPMTRLRFCLLFWRFLSVLHLRKVSLRCQVMHLTQRYIHIEHSRAFAFHALLQKKGNRCCHKLLSGGSKATRALKHILLSFESFQQYSNYQMMAV